MFESTIRTKLEQHFIQVSQQEYYELFTKLPVDTLRGTTCEVYQAIMNESKEKIALKEYIRSQMKYESSQIRLLREVQNLKACQAQNQRGKNNILKLIGCFRVHSQFYQTFVVATQFCQNGCLTNHLKSIASKSDKYKFIISKQIALGIEFLHSLEIIHRDIKPDNIFVQEQNDILTMKIGDLGASKKQTMNMTMMTGTLSYMDPQFYYSEEYKQECDIVAFALTIYEVFTGAYIIQFYQGKSDLEEKMINLINKPNRFLSKQKNLPESIKKLIQDCLNRQNRINMKEVVVFLEEEIKKIDDEEIQNNIQISQAQEYQSPVINTNNFKKIKEPSTESQCNTSFQLLLDKSVSEFSIGDRSMKISNISEYRSDILFSEIKEQDENSSFYKDDRNFDRKIVSDILPSSQKPFKKIYRKELSDKKLEEIYGLLSYHKKIENDYKKDINECLKILKKSSQKIQIIKNVSKEPLKESSQKKYSLILLGFMIVIAQLKQGIQKYPYMPDNIRKKFESMISNTKILSRDLFHLFKSNHHYEFKQKKWILQFLEHDNPQILRSQLKDKIRFKKNLSKFNSIAQ